MSRLVVVAALLVLSSAAWAQNASTPARRQVREACAADAQQLCKGMTPGGGKLAACFREHNAELSQGCRTAIDAQRAQRGKPATGG